MVRIVSQESRRITSVTLGLTSQERQMRIRQHRCHPTMTFVQHDERRINDGDTHGWIDATQKCELICLIQILITRRPYLSILVLLQPARSRVGTYPVASIAEVVDVRIDPGKLRVVAGGVAVPDVDVGIGEGLAGVDVEHANLKEHGNTGLAVYTPRTPSLVA